MLRRAIIAENESQRLLQECNDLQAKIKDNLGQESSSIGINLSIYQSCNITNFKLM
jgi:hypothetical protein